MATLLVRWVVVDLVMRCIFNTTLHYRDETCELLLDSDAVIETVNTGLTPLKEVVGAGLSEVPGLASGMDSLVVCPTVSASSFTKWNLDKEGEENEEYNRLDITILMLTCLTTSDQTE